MNWILFGFKGSGKTYFAKRLQLPYIDIDEELEKKEKLKIREIVEQKGERYFRKSEREIIQNLHVTNHIISVGGGAVLDANNLKNLYSLGKLIYLKCPKLILQKRILTPPLPTYIDSKDPLNSFEKIYYIRIAKYEKIQAFHIRLEGKNSQQVLKELWQVIGSEKFFASLLGEKLMEKQLE